MQPHQAPVVRIDQKFGVPPQSRIVARSRKCGDTLAIGMVRLGLVFCTLEAHQEHTRVKQQIRRSG